MSDNIQPLEIGTKAPGFTAKTNGDGEISLDDFAGRTVILYFYPKDNTPGCTTEAVDFSALYDEFAALDAQIIGVSPDSVQKHDNFVAKHNLSVLLASDPETTICNAYGTWVEKQMYGKSYMGVERSTFLIDKNGKIAKIWRKVKVKNHASDVLQSVRDLTA
nr:thioredoxin-dependent thiol peroxidase [uncultured Cohaesibacter sp.]